ncbi:hypothetical protein GI584_06225 [Gracilibacillus salitolerans]|uniref:Glycoside hydrolase family 38 N-terminal domain-containing protein n=1 Tax=Gracilibacillus salitolerans TaxID=2663022 RepID=A0A5Q2THM9_9BACI|nr:glycosyl hydrolase-related protein [Gracilibacillus salitolerans]QGH33637.1 hypothetical protein GI584_06225 [Gracilibacillus salitolerans]
MKEITFWQIGSTEGKSNQLVDNYKDPTLFADVVWNVEDAHHTNQKWPLFHPSEADPEFGYKRRPYTIKFNLDHQPQGSYVLRMHYLVIAPRLAFVEMKINGTKGNAYLHPNPSQSGEINLHSGLHTTIYSDGVLEVVIPDEQLKQGENVLELVSRDGGDYIRVDNVEKIKRLDRMANGAGFIYQSISLLKKEVQPESSVKKLAIEPTVLYKRNKNGELVERCYVYLESNQALHATSLSLEIQVADEMQILTIPIPTISFGHITHTFDLIDGEGVVTYRILGKINGEDFEQSGTIQRKRKWKVYITPHSHTDIGYTHRQWEVGERLCRNIDTAIQFLESGNAGDTFSYHLDASWVLEAYIELRSEQQVEKLFQYVQQGKIGIPHSYGDLLTQYASLEDLIRNGEFSESLLRPRGLRSKFTSIVDVPSMTGSLPKVLQDSGVKFLVHANNQDRGPFRLNGGLHKISPYYWEGNHGGKVLVWLAKMYCELRKVCGSPPVISSAERGLELWLDEYETESYAPDAVLLYGQEADNTDMDPQPVDFTKQWNEMYEYPKLIPSNVEDFFEYVEGQFSDHFQTVKGDGGGYWEDGVGSTIEPVITIRKAQSMLPAAEKLESLAAIHNPNWKYPNNHFDQAWHTNLQFVEHTWGAFLSGTDPDALLQHDQWAIKHHFARDGLQKAKRLLDTAAVRHSLNWNNNGREVVVYNAHSWRVSGPVQVEIAKNEKVYNAVTGEEMQTRKVKETTTQAIVEIWINNLPGLSYQRMVLKNVSNQAENDRSIDQHNQKVVVLENDFYRMELVTERACLVSLLDKENETELVDKSDEFGFGQFVYAKGGEGTRLVGNSNDLADGDPELLTDFELFDVKVESFDYGQSVQLVGKVTHGELKVAWTLWDQLKQIDVQYSLDKEEKLEKEAIYIAFPTNLKQATIKSDSQIGWVNWDKDQLPGACKEWLPVQSTMLLANEEASIAIATPDIPLFTIGNVVKGRWPKELDLTGNRVFSYVLNNYWHTNYKASQSGQIEIRYSITSANQIKHDQAYRFGWQQRRPIYGHRISFQDFRTVHPPYQSEAGGQLAQLDTDQVSLVTLKKAKWEVSSWIIRLQEIAGQTSTATFEVPKQKIQFAKVTDLLEKETEKLEVNANGSLTVHMEPWEVKTILITL